MRFFQREPDKEYNDAIIRDIKQILNAQSHQEQRPCSGCKFPCACSHSISCSCMCGHDCEKAPIAMSSDTGFPIENNIFKLVFGLNCLSVCPPYWSCEGHLNDDGLFRLPQVWFYSRSIIYPKIISEYLSNLSIRDETKYHWHICLPYSGSGFEAGFSIEPDIRYEKSPSLRFMQDDVSVISHNFVIELKAIAQKYLEEYQHQNL